jgi:uncharacterized membrane protein YcaP (DUF421 family)
MGEWDPISLAAVATRTAILFGVIFAALRATGKRQFGEMNTHDLLLVVVVCNAVQNGMTRQSPHLSVALVSAGTLLAIGWVLGYLTGRSRSMERRLFGVPIVLIENGRVIGRHLREQSVTENELMAAVRGRGLVEPAQVRLAVLEVNGAISIVPRERPRA